MLIPIADIPGHPFIKNVTQDECDAVIKWSMPKKILSNGCPILFYKITYRKSSFGDQESKEVTVANTGVNQKKLSLECNTAYNFQVSAVNKVGSGHPSQLWKATIGEDSTQKTTPPEGMTWTSAIF